MAKVLIVDDEVSIRRTLKEILEFEKYQVEEASDGFDALSRLKKEPFDVVILDIKMAKMDGMETLEKIQNICDIPVIMMSGHATIDTAVECVKKGAFDFICKPPDLNRMLITLRNALDKSSLITETKALRNKTHKTKIQEMIGDSEPMQNVKNTINKIAPTEARVFITGENGTGKELVARWIHEKSQRASYPMVEVNCAAIPSELIESELFGHEKGSFTSAFKQRIGKFELANGGTLFLDEIGDMSLSAQAKVLRALQENKIVRVGGEREIKVDVRVIAATNKDIRKMIELGKFREDLYHRLSVIVVPVPSLKERRADIPLLIENFNKTIAEANNLPPRIFTDDAMEALMNYKWTGNIRELLNVTERLNILGDKLITVDDVNKYVVPTGSQTVHLHEFLEQFKSMEEMTQYLQKEYAMLHEDVH